jgi:DNA ligase-1
MDGELWIGRGKFEKTSGILRKKVPIDEEWKDVKFMVFDVPRVDAPFTDRLEYLQKLENDVVKPVKNWICEGPEHLM